MYKLVENKWFMRGWTLLMFILLISFHFVQPAHAGCGWTQGDTEYQAADMLVGIGGVAGIIGLFIPPIGIAGVVLGGLGAAYIGVLHMSGC